MRYIIESICPECITLYYRFNFKDANNWAQFLHDKYNVETKVYNEEEYMILHPEMNFIE